MTGVTGEQLGWSGDFIACPVCRASCVPTVDGAGWVLPWHPDVTAHGGVVACAGSGRIVVGIAAT